MENLIEFEELNVLNSEKERNIIPIPLYFEDMEGLTEEQKSTREEFADEIEDLIFMIFAMMDYQAYTEQRLKTVMAQRYTDIASRFRNPDDYIKGYINRISAEIVHTTYAHREDPYYTSFDRGMHVAENEANTVVNHYDFEDARRSGKTQKRWETMGDERVRPTHWAVDGVTIPIDEPFEVGNSLLMYPKDMSLGADASEIILCRCWVIYL